MESCKECLHYEVCADFRRNICETDQRRFEEYKINSDGLCENFKNKADFQEVKRVKRIPMELLHDKFKCPECGNKDIVYTDKYCSECGAKFDDADNVCKE